jgi:[acyl-carrier-protein] S-malonyltransferase
MGLDLYRSHAKAREFFDQADGLLGFPLSRLCFEGPKEDLDHDLNAQLAVYTVSCIITDILRENNVLPDMVSGYSSGFYAAGYAAGCFDFANGLSLVKQAGEILLNEGRKIEGAMAVIFGLSVERVKSICQQIGDVEVAILNTPRQNVISGTLASVQKAMGISLEQGALDAYPLSAATAYHSRLMEGSGVRFSNEISVRSLRDPRLPLISYLSLDPVQDKTELATIMATQLSRPVYWVNLIHELGNRCTRLFVEVGPGQVLSRTVRWIDRKREIVNTGREKDLLQSVERYKTLNKI